MLRKTTFVTLLLLASARPGFAQASPPAEPEPGALMEFERAIESAAARGDVAFLARALADDFAFTHGDAWRTGGEPSLVDTKQSCAWELVSHRTVAESAT